MIHLVSPSLKYQQSYLQAVEAMRQENSEFAKNYPAADLAGQIAKWEQLRADGVAYRYWLVAGDKYLGTIRLRRRAIGPHPGLRGHVHFSTNPNARRQGYGKLLLKLGLEEARKLGFRKLIITCKDTNLGSKKIIEANGGQLIKQGTVQGDYEPITILKYQIKL